MAVTLETAQARITLRPDLGAGLTGFDIRRGGEWLPVFRRVDAATAHPFALSNIVLLPFSGRVSGGGFSFDGSFHALPRNMETERYPLHGNAFSLPWTTTDHSADRITLRLAAEGPGPFRYDAVLTFRLLGAGLEMAMTVTNRAAMRLPYGAGFHPWFVRDPDTTLMRPPAMSGWNMTTICPARMSRSRAIPTWISTARCGCRRAGSTPGSTAGTGGRGSTGPRAGSRPR